ncbi:MAG: thioredoxin domain-containing protein [Phycisphaerae bacterium]
MSRKRPERNQTRQSSQPANRGGTRETRASAAAAPPSRAAGLWLAGLVLLAAAELASALLVLDHFGGLSLPGCGKGSPCAAATSSVWGRIPGIRWPVSFVALAYFSAAAVAWALRRDASGAGLRAILRVGGAVSMFYLGLIFAKGYYCPYCLAAHIANLGACGVAELRPGGSARAGRQLGAFAATFATVTAGLGVASMTTSIRVEQSREDDLRESIRDLQTAGGGATTQGTASAVSTTDPATTTAPPSTAPGLSDAVPVNAEAAAALERWPHGFTGRYRLGPADAPIRIVMFTDYQCTDCQRIEKEVMEVVRARSDVSLSIKHFPFNTPCNPNAPNLHANACWAARCAETAGMLRGDEGFFQVHEWLFAQQGSFTDAEIQAALPTLGFDANSFLALMQGPETLARVKSDIEEGVAVGLYFTPLVFINGIEVRGILARDAVKRAVEALAETKPPPRSASSDRPALAATKFVDDWRAGHRIANPADTSAWPRGPAGAPLEIVMWGDYQEPITAEADRLIRAFIAGRSDARYTFRHFPFNQDCNTGVPRTQHPLACLASRAAEAAGRAGSLQTYWRMHEWLMDNPKSVNDESVRARAVGFGVDAAAFEAALASAETKAAIDEDVLGAQRVGLSALPTIYVNGRFVPRWKRPNDNVLERIFNAALAEARP